MGGPLDLDPKTIFEHARKHVQAEGVVQITRTGENVDIIKLLMYIIVTQADVTFKQLQAINIFYHKVTIRKYVNKQATHPIRCIQVINFLLYFKTKVIISINIPSNKMFLFLRQHLLFKTSKINCCEYQVYGKEYTHRFHIKPETKGWEWVDFR